MSAITTEALISNREADVLAHTSNTGRYVTGDASVLALAERGFLFDHGAQRLAGGDHYLTMTAKGRAALLAWRAAQPKPRKPKRRRSEQFDRWRSYCESVHRISFGEFLRTVWPHRREWA